MLSVKRDRAPYKNISKYVQINARVYPVYLLDVVGRGLVFSKHIFWMFTYSKHSINEDDKVHLKYNMIIILKRGGGIGLVF
jgi:hypothetical protein